MSLVSCRQCRKFHKTTKFVFAENFICNECRSKIPILTDEELRIELERWRNDEVRGFKAIKDGR